MMLASGESPMFRACGPPASSAVTLAGSIHKSRGNKVAVIQESKLSSNSKTPSIQNFSTVRKDRRQGQVGGLLTLIHNSTNISQKTESPKTLVEPHLPTISTDSSPHQSLADTPFPMRPG